MRVLTAVFPHAGRVSLDVANIVGGFVEGRSKEQNHRLGGPDEPPVRPPGFLTHGDPPSYPPRPNSKRPAAETIGDVPAGLLGNTEQVGWLLYTDYLIPFEVASMLLLVAMVGAIILAKREL